MAEIAQHAVAEVHVFAQDASIPAYIPPEPALNTYMAVCHDSSVLAGTNADTGHLLVKIGISNDKERRLQELNGNHIAVIFGVRFAHYAEGLWPTQSKSMAVERKAHEWCHLNGRHASGEYFYLPKEKLIAAGTIVRTGKI
ncbi:GIY-YIG nuclease family protein [Ensifer canadensis]|uniref:GIY-YIG nuclease family protein n=1 Tax=Ensifer canadensis TaxID=555315 RepID=UPI0035E3E4CC